MPRNYQRADYDTSFQGSQQAIGFDPVRAFDDSNVHKQRAQEQIQNIQTLARGAARQAQLDMATLQADQAASSAKFATLKGILALSSTAMQGYQEIQKVKEQRANEDALLESIGWGEEPVAPTPQEKVDAAQQHTAVAAEASGTAKVAEEYKQQGTLNGASVAHALQQSTAYQLLTGIDGNGYTAAANHGIFLAEALRSLPPEAQPKSAADAQVLMRELNRQFLRGSGMINAPREQLLRLAQTMQGNTQNSLVSLVNSTIKAEQANNQELAKGFVSSLTESGASPEEVWAKASERYAFGNLGYTGHSAASNVAALEDVLQNYAEVGDTAAINAMRNVLQVPGQAGTELGKKYDHIFDKYETAARKGAIENYNLNNAEKGIEMKKSLEFFYNDPTPENRQKAVQILRGLGTEDALKEAERLSANGLNYDPQKKFELMELQQKGIAIPEDTLQQLVREGTISAEEYKQFSTSGPEKAGLKVVDSYLKDVSGGLKTAMQGDVPSANLTATVKTELAIRHQMLMEDLRRSVSAEVKANPALANDMVELSRVVEAKAKFLMSQPQYTLKMDAKKGPYFTGEISADKRLARITVAPGVQDFTKLAPEQLFTPSSPYPRTEMDATKDRFLPVAELKADVKRVLEGKDPSNKARLLAKHLGLSSTAFIEGQLGVNGLPSLGTLRQGPDAMKALNSLHNIPSASEGMKVLRSMGFPAKGAAYLAGNIQQESGWNGLRRWGEVAGDGSDANGGLISWMDDAQRNHYRLRQAERHFGKPIDQVPESDQLAYMVMEMKKRNPSAYRTFMDPNADEGALERASLAYWGYGHKGARFTYARNLLAKGRL